MSWFDDLWRKEADDWTARFLEADEAPDAPAPIAPDAGYLSVELASLRITHVRVGLTKLFGTVHSHLSLAHRSGTDASFRVVTTPSELRNLDASGLDRVVQAGVPLLGPVPYRDGAIGAEIGLFSVKAADLAQPYLTLLDEASKAAGTSFVGTARPWIELIGKGMQMLTLGASADMLEIGFRGRIQARTGWFAMLRADRATLEARGLKVDPRDQRLTDGQGRALADIPWMLLRVTLRPDRNEWTSIPGVKAAYDSLNDAVLKGRDAEVNEALAVFRRTVMTSPDLLFAHARALAQKVEAEVRETLAPAKVAMVPTSATARPGLRSLEALSPFGG